MVNNRSDSTKMHGATIRFIIVYNHYYYQPTTALTLTFTWNTFKNTENHSDMFRSCQIIIRELCCSLLKLYYNIHNSIRFCKQGGVAACHVVKECVVTHDAHLANCSLYNTFLHNMICCHNTLFAKTNWIVNIVI